MRPVQYPDKTLVLPPRLCASVDYYAHVWEYGNYIQNWGLRFDKRMKDAHRFTIADTRGPLTLTVPIAKPESSSCSWGDIRISTHGAWWDVHRVALESAYGRTPYFEFYIDRFLPMLTVGVAERYPSLASLALAWDAEIRKILTFAPSCQMDGDAVNTVVTEVAARHKFRLVDESQGDFGWQEHPLPPYYQVRADKLGFIPNLSILDLIFNLGPEAPIYLHTLTTR